MGSANERRCCVVTSSLIGWAHTQNDPWCSNIYGLKKTDLKGDITHCGLVMSVILAHFVSGNDLLPIWCQVITWTSAILISIRTWRPNFNLILIKFWTFSFKKMHLKLSSAKWLPFFSNSVLRIMKNNNSYCQVACQAAFVIKGGWEYWYLSAYITTEW